ncbi:MAG: class I SAM-dependent methyltransferase [Candidatus Limnocylindrales bacterium]|nr:class I SAM-dependent methyltransferase [Candidatus Limnocylindrales bacterium]
MPYDPRTEWSRLHARGDLSSVGQSGLPADLNAWLYRALERRVRWFARRHRVFDGVKQVFDVGAGTGYWVRVWHDLGVPRVDGCDLVPAAVDRLDAEFATRGDRFVAADIGASGPDLPQGPYDLVSVMNVLLHVTDDEAFLRALASVAELVGPGGWLLLVEPILLDPAYERPATPEQTSRARSLAAYRDPVMAAGLELVELRGAVAMANNPIEAGSRSAYDRYVRWWRWLARRAKASPGSIWWLGPVVLAFDRVALATGAAPSSKIVLFRRPDVQDRVSTTPG